jgi:hypothetical protein
MFARIGLGDSLAQKKSIEVAERCHMPGYGSGTETGLVEMIDIMAESVCVRPVRGSAKEFAKPL